MKCERNSRSDSVVERGTDGGQRSRGPVPRRLHLGHGDRRPPGRGQQLEQRLVGVGAQPRLGPCVEPSGDACDSLPPLRRRHRHPRRPRLRQLPVLDRVEPHRARGGRVLDAPRSTTTAGCARPASSAASTPVVTFHHFTTPRWVAAPRRLGRSPTPSTASPASASGPPSTSATCIGRACTINEPNIVADHRLPARGCSRPAPRPGAARARSTTSSRRAPQGASTPSRAGAPAIPVGLTLAMSDYQAGRRRRGAARAASARPWRTSTSRPPPATTSSACRPTRACAIGPDGTLGPEAGVARRSMGYEFWPEALEATHPAGVGASPTAHADPRHRERHRHRRRRASASSTSSAALAGRARLHRRRHRRARLHVLEPARQLRVGPRLRPRSASSPSTATPSSARRSRRPAGWQRSWPATR